MSDTSPNETTTASSQRSVERVLIAGYGYLGRCAAKLWQNEGTNIVAVTRSDEKAARLTEQGVQPIVADLSAATEFDLPPVDTVLWSVGFDRSSANRKAIWIDGLDRLLFRLPSSVQRLIYVSSTGVYGQSDGEDVSESTLAEPVTESGKCCLKAEGLLHRWAAARTRVSVSVLRMAGIYGPNRLLRRTSDLRAGTPLPGDPDSWLNLIHVDDAAHAIVGIARQSGTPLLNVVSRNTVTRREYYELLARLVNAPAPRFSGEPAARGGNKRVVSDVIFETGLSFQFDDVAAGLQDAVERSDTVN